MLGGAASAGGGVSATRGSSVSCEKKIVSHSSRETFLSPSRSESSNSRSVGLTPCAAASCGEGYMINGAVQVMVWAVGIAKQQRHGGATAVRQGARVSLGFLPSCLNQRMPNSKKMPASPTRALCPTLSGSQSGILNVCKDG